MGMDWIMDLILLQTGACEPGIYNHIFNRLSTDCNLFPSGPFSPFEQSDYITKRVLYFRKIS